MIATKCSAGASATRSKSPSDPGRSRDAVHHRPSHRDHVSRRAIASWSKCRYWFPVIDRNPQKYVANIFDARNPISSKPPSVSTARKSCLERRDFHAPGGSANETLRESVSFGLGRYAGGVAGNRIPWRQNMATYFADCGRSPGNQVLCTWTMMRWPFWKRDRGVRSMVNGVTTPALDGSGFRNELRKRRGTLRRRSSIHNRRASSPRHFFGIDVDQFDDQSLSCRSWRRRVRGHLTGEPTSSFRTRSATSGRRGSPRNADPRPATCTTRPISSG